MKCKLCKSANLSTIYTASDIPVFQNKVYETLIKAENAMTGNVKLAMCLNCGFVFNEDFDNKVMNYDDQYQNEQAHSTYFQKYLEELICLLTEKKFHEKKIIEIGCGKGFFLEMLREKGFDVVGFEPAYSGDKPYVIKDYYSDKYSYLDADLIILRHTLEHIQEPLQFLHTISNSAKTDAKIFIEVPSFEWIVNQKAFWDIFHEHCNYFTVKSIANLFQNSEQGLLFNDQYMYLIADLKDLRKQIMPSEISSPDFEISKMIDLYEFYREFIRNHPGIMVWGAGAKGVTFVNLTDPKREYITNLVDISPAKQGRYIARAGHRIISPAQLAEARAGEILVMNENYYHEIGNQVKETRIKLYTLGEI
ncbi:MAG: methyltransferase domain-containing protein [Desulfobacteraceae bacterium]|nr:methyltransferase domain-containing protein [Desulfobacteraceae bacterium]